jgi:hypothetical protein
VVPELASISILLKTEGWLHQNTGPRGKVSEGEWENVPLLTISILNVNDEVFFHGIVEQSVSVLMSDWPSYQKNLRNTPCVYDVEQYIHTIYTFQQ